MLSPELVFSPIVHDTLAVKYYWLMKLRLRATTTAQAIELWHTLKKAELFIAVLLGSGEETVEKWHQWTHQLSQEAVPLLLQGPVPFRSIGVSVVSNIAPCSIDEYLTTRCH